MYSNLRIPIRWPCHILRLLSSMKTHKEQRVLVVVTMGHHPIVVTWFGVTVVGCPSPRPARF